MEDWITNGIRYINKEGLFRVINPSASVSEGTAEPFTPTQGRCKNLGLRRVTRRRMISVKW